MLVLRANAFRAGHVEGRSSESEGRGVGRTFANRRASRRQEATSVASAVFEGSTTACLRSFRLAIVTAVWRRPYLSQLLLRWYEELKGRLSDSLAVHLLAVGSEGEVTRQMAMAHGWDYVEAPNYPLTNKWNAASSACQNKNPDAVMIVGSDDFVSDSYVLAAAKAMATCNLFGLTDLWFFDSTPPVRLGYWPGYKGEREGEPIGAGRIFRKDLLDAVDWKLWDPLSPLNSGLDRQSLERVQATGVLRMQVVQLESVFAFAVDVKSTEGNLWRWDQFQYSVVYHGQDALNILGANGIPVPSKIDSKRGRSEHDPGGSPHAVAEVDSVSIPTLVITAHDAAPFVGRCLDSVASQTRVDWRVVFVDDASTDGTADEVERVAAELGISDRLTVVRHKERRYKTRNVVEAVREIVGDDEVVVMLDGDDWLAHDSALETLAEDYRKGWDVVWGNWTGSDGMPGTSWHLNPFLPPRKQPWVTSAPFSFRAHLLKSIPDAEFLDDTGEWFRCACDQAIVLPVFERTTRRKHIEEVLYVYNRSNPNSNDQQGRRRNPLVSEAQAQASKVLYSRPAAVPPWDAGFFKAHRFDFVHAAMASAQRFGGDAARRIAQTELARLDAQYGRNA